MAPTIRFLEPGLDTSVMRAFLTMPDHCQVTLESLRKIWPAILRATKTVLSDRPVPDCDAQTMIPVPDAKRLIVTVAAMSAECMDRGLRGIEASRLYVHAGEAPGSLRLTSDVFIPHPGGMLG